LDVEGRAAGSLTGMPSSSKVSSEARAGALTKTSAAAAAAAWLGGLGAATTVGATGAGGAIGSLVKSWRTLRTTPCRWRGMVGAGLIRNGIMFLRRGNFSRNPMQKCKVNRGQAASPI
jgi:hypothetical protein